MKLSLVSQLIQCFQVNRWTPREFPPNQIPCKRPLLPDLYSYQEQKIPALYLYGGLRLVTESLVCVSSVMSDSLQPHGVKPARLLCPWDFPGKNTGICCHFLLQGTFLTQGLNTHLLHWQVDFLPLVSPGMLRVIMLLWKLTIPLWQFEATYQNKVFPSLWPSWSPHPVNFMIQQLQTVSLCKPYMKDLLCCQSLHLFPS